MRRFRKWAITALGLLAIGGAVAWAQQLPIRNWTGLERINITLQSGSGTTIALSTIRNTVGTSPVGAATTTNSSPTGILGYLIASGAITTWNTQLPNPTTDGHRFCISNATSGSLTGNTVFAGSTSTQTQTMNTTYNGQTLAAGASACWLLVMPDGITGVWYRVQ